MTRSALFITISVLFLVGSATSVGQTSAAEKFKFIGKGTSALTVWSMRSVNSAPIYAQTLEWFSASKETNGPLASGTDVISLFNPSDSGKTIYLDHLQCSLGSSFAKEPGFDIWVSNTPGANCARVIERKPAKLAGGPVSVAIVNAQCNPRPALDPQWYDGPLYQFAVGDFGPRLDLSNIELPPGKGITVRTDYPSLRTDETVQWHLVWRE